MSFTSKFGPALCLVMLTNGPKEKPVYLPICDYLFGQGFTPIEVRSPGEALIHTRQAKFSLIIMPEDDNALIKKIKSSDGLNANTIIIAISSADELSASTQELLDLKVIQKVVTKTTNLEEFQTKLLEAVKSHLFNDGMETKENEMAATTEYQIPTKQENGCAILKQDSKEQFSVLNSQSDNFYAFSSQSDQPYVVSSQSQLPLVAIGQTLYPYSAASQSHQPCVSTYQSGEFLSSLPLQPFALFHPMVVPYSSLLPGNAPCSIPTSDSYLMPRIVNFSPSQNQMFPHLVGQPLTLPAFTMPQGLKPEAISEQFEPDSTGHVQDTLPGVTVESDRQGTTPAITVSSDVKDECNSNEKLPGIQKFLECLCPEMKNEKNDDGKMTVDVENFEQRINHGEKAPKKPRLDERQTPVACQRIPSNEDQVDKNPLSVLQARPYFMNLDEQIEQMAFDPKVKASDRHNAKERHRRIRITRAADFFKSILPCMCPAMDKASVFHVTVYYLIFLRNALRQIDPCFVDQLHKSYTEEWKAYFESTIKNDKQSD